MLNLSLTFNLTIGAFTQGPVQVEEGAGAICIRRKIILYDLHKYITLNKKKISETFMKIHLFRPKFLSDILTILSTINLQSLSPQFLQSN